MIASCVGCALLLAVAQTSGADEIADRVAALGDARSSTRRMEAYRELVRTKPEAAVPLVVAGLPEWQLTCQSLGVSLLTTYPRATAKKALRRLTRSRVPFLACASAAWLLRIGETGHTKTILAALADPTASSLAKIYMIGRLDSIRDRELRAGLRALLVPGIDVSFLEALLSKLWVQKDIYAKAQVRAILASDETSTRARAVCASYLLGLGEQDAAPALAEALRTNDAVSLYRVELMLRDAPRLGKVVRDALLERIEVERSATNLRYLVRILESCGDTRVRPLLRRLLEGNKPGLAKIALEALSKVEGGLEIAALRRVADRDSATLALAAIEALRRRDDSSRLERLVELAKTSLAARREATRILGGFREPRAVVPLFDALADSDLTVRSRAFAGLGAVLRSVFPYKRLNLASTGYLPRAAARERAEGLRRIRAWWLAHRPKR